MSWSHNLTSLHLASSEDSLSICCSAQQRLACQEADLSFVWLRSVHTLSLTLNSENWTAPTCIKKRSVNTNKKAAQTAPANRTAGNHQGRNTNAVACTTNIGSATRKDSLHSAIRRKTGVATTEDVIKTSARKRAAIKSRESMPKSDCFSTRFIGQ